MENVNTRMKTRYGPGLLLSNSAFNARVPASRIFHLLTQHREKEL